MKIGFIGCGVMGKSMARRLKNAGHDLVIYSRTKEKCLDLIAEGVRWADCVADSCEDREVVMTMVGLPTDVEQVYFSEQGILSSMKSGTIVVDFTTSLPSLAEKISSQIHDIGSLSLDAPVSGGDIGARNGTLSIMVGGDRPAFDKLEKVWSQLGSKWVFQGGAGSGQRTKICNQLLICTNMIGVCEALIFAAKSGLDPEKVMQSVESGAAGSWSLSNLGTRILKNDFKPGFFVEHFVKDLSIALEEAKTLSLNLPGLEMATGFYKNVMDMGYERKGTQALYLYLKSISES